MQHRYMTREEALERIARRKMRAQMEANLREIEEEEKDNRLASFEADVS
jgi:DNA topoisomerase IA